MAKDFFTYKQLGDEKDDKPSNVKKPGDMGALPTTTPKETIIVGVESGKVNPNQKPPTYSQPTNTTPTPESAFDKWFDTYQKQLSQSGEQGQKYSNAIYDSIDKFNTRYDDLYKEIKEFDPLASDWAKSLMSYYGIESGAAADSARASGAADNAGNVDSYAAANAERQRLSKLNAGISAISGMSNERFANMLATLEGLGANVNGLFGLEGQYNLPTMQGNANTAASGAISTNASDAELESLMSQILAGSGTGETSEESTSIPMDVDSVKNMLLGYYASRYPNDSSMTDSNNWMEVLNDFTNDTKLSNNRPYFMQIISEIIKQKMASTS